MLREDWLPATFSKVVHRRREFLRISQEELSHRSGLHRTYISDVERGARNVSLKNMSKLAAALEISPSALIRWTEIRNLKELSTAVEPELADFLDTTGMGYLLIDSAGAVLDVNATQLAWLNRSIETVVGARVFELFLDDDRQNLSAALDSVSHDGIPQRVRAHLNQVGDAPIVVSLELTAIRDEASEFSMTRLCASKVSGANSNSNESIAPAADAGLKLVGLEPSIAPLPIFRTISEDGPIPIVGVGPDSRIQFWNLAAQQTFGYTAEEALGAPVGIIVPPAKQAEIKDILSRAGRNFGRQQIDVNYLAKNGTILPLSMICSPIKTPTASAGNGFEGIACHFMQSQTESLRNHLLQMELGVLSALEDSESFTAAVPRILEALACARWDFAMLWWVDPDGGQLRPFSHLCSSTMPPDTVPSLTEGIRFLNYGLPRIVWESRQSFWIEDVATEPRCRPQVTENTLGLRSGVWFPITVGREVIGVFEMLSNATQQADSAVLDCFTALGARIGRSILRSGERPRIAEESASSPTKKVRQ